MKKDVLDYFGEMLISNVRDKTIASWDMMVNGKMKGITAQQVREKISSFSDEQKEILRWLTPQITDTCLHYLLTMFEQSDELKLTVCIEQANVDLKQISDGLAGELYTEDGWINRFSKEIYDQI